MHFSIILLCAFATILCVQACTQPEINMYESEGWGEDYVLKARRLDSRVNVPDVSVFGIENYNTYHCSEGAWILHSEVNYTGTVTVDASSECQYVNSGRKIHSLSIVGSPVNSSISTVNTFPLEFYGGVQTTHYEAVKDLQIPFKSLILMGAESVEFFVKTNFEGLSICVQPYRGVANNVTQLMGTGPGMSTQWIDSERGTFIQGAETVFGINPAQIKSFRFGCNSDKKTHQKKRVFNPKFPFKLLNKHH